MVGGGRPPVGEIVGPTDTVHAKMHLSINFFTRSTSAITTSEKTSINSRSLLCAF